MICCAPVPRIAPTRSCMPTAAAPPVSAPPFLHTCQSAGAMRARVLPAMSRVEGSLNSAKISARRFREPRRARLPEIHHSRTGQRPVVLRRQYRHQALAVGQRHHRRHAVQIPLPVALPYGRADRQPHRVHIPALLDHAKGKGCSSRAHSPGRWPLAKSLPAPASIRRARETPCPPNPPADSTSHAGAARESAWEAHAPLPAAT